MYLGISKQACFKKSSVQNNHRFAAGTVRTENKYLVSYNTVLDFYSPDEFQDPGSEIYQWLRKV